MGSAIDISQEGKKPKKTVQADDMYQALTEMGFDKYVEEIKDLMKNYKEEKVV